MTEVYKVVITGAMGTCTTEPTILEVHWGQAVSFENMTGGPVHVSSEFFDPKAFDIEANQEYRVTVSGGPGHRKTKIEIGCWGGGGGPDMVIDN